FLDSKDEHLAVADLTGAGRLDDGVDGFGDAFVGNNHFDLDLGRQIHFVLLPAVDLLVALLAAVTAHVVAGHAIDPDAFEGVADVVELVRLDDRFNALHASLLNTIEIVPSVGLNSDPPRCALDLIGLLAMLADVQTAALVGFVDAHPDREIDEL